MTLASLCVLAYNRPEHLLRTIGEIHATADRPYELLVHDDGSTDEKVQEILSAALASGRVSSVISNPPGHNMGVGVAMNRMFQVAQGGVLVKLDSDLLYGQHWLSRAMDLLKSNQLLSGKYRQEFGNRPKAQPRIGVLGFMHYDHDPVASAKCKIADHGEGSHGTGTGMGAVVKWERHTHILGSAFAMPREAWREFGPFEQYSEAFAEDWHMMQRITDRKGWCCALPPQSMVQNVGMGVGRSTVVCEDGSIQSIKKGPVVFGG